MALFRIIAGIATVYAVVQAGESSTVPSMDGMRDTARAATATMQDVSAFCSARAEACASVAAAGIDIARRQAAEAISATMATPERSSAHNSAAADRATPAPSPAPRAARPAKPGESKPLAEARTRPDRKRS